MDDSTQNPRNKIQAIGLSISKCVLAIADGFIPFEAVDKIIGGTMFADISELLTEYSEIYWVNNSLSARKVMGRLVSEGRFYQPRLYGGNPPDSTKGIWLVGEMHLSTDQLRELLEISDFFLNMENYHRDVFFEKLGPNGLNPLIQEILNERLKPLFPTIDQISPQLPSTVLFRMVKDRLKQFFQQASDEERDQVHCSIIQALAPFLKMFMENPESDKLPETLEEPPFRYSIMRPLLVPKDGNGEKKS